MSIKSGATPASAYDSKQQIKSYRYSDSTEHPLDVKSQLFVIDKDGEMVTEHEIKVMAGLEADVKAKRRLNNLKKEKKKEDIQPTSPMTPLQ